MSSSADTPFDDAHDHWPEDLKRERVTELVKEIDPPVGVDEFDHAWEALAKDRPRVPAYRCPYRRALIKEFYDQLYD